MKDAVCHVKCVKIVGKFFINKTEKNVKFSMSTDILGVRLSNSLIS